MNHHGGQIGKSKRLDKMYDALVKHEQLTSLKLQKITGGVAIGSTAADLRKAGANIPPAKYLGWTASGSKVYLYQLKDKI